MERRTFEDSFRDAFKDAEATPSDKVWTNIELELEKGRVAMERRVFEDSLRNAFKDAEATPSEQVWTNVELELEKEKGSKMRRSLAFYQMLAAAAVVLALLSTGVAYFMINQRDQTIERLAANARLSQQDNDRANQQPAVGAPGVGDNPSPAAATNPLATNRGADETNGESQQRSSLHEPGVANRIGGANVDAATALTRDPAQGDKGPALAKATCPGALATGEISADGTPPAGAITQSAYSGTVTDPEASIAGTMQNGTAADSYVRNLPSFYTATIRQPALPASQVDPVQMMMAKLAEEEMKYAAGDNDEKKKDLGKEKVWTALGVAAGGFSSVGHTTTPPQSMGLAFANNQAVADKQARANGVAYSLGLSFGTKVAPRWVIQGGVNYLTQSSNYVANNVVFDASYSSLQAESINALGKIPALADAASAQNLAPTVPYSVNNSLKYFSVPMQAGYLLVNKKFGVQLNAGISTDLFLQNTITPEGGSLDKTTQSSGSESPYRTVNFSGLMGTEFSYRLGQRYRIALNPALRYPLNSVYKSDVGIESTPLTFDVGLRFRYIFK